MARGEHFFAPAVTRNLCANAALWNAARASNRNHGNGARQEEGAAPMLLLALRPALTHGETKRLPWGYPGTPELC